MLGRLMFILILCAGIGAVFLWTDIPQKLEATFHYLQGNLAYQEGDFDTAYTDYQQALPHYFWTDRVLMKLGDTANQQENIQEALSYYKQAVDISPTSVQAVNRLARLHWKLGNERIALGVYQMALRQDPSQLTLRKAYGQLYLKLARKTQEKQDYRAAADVLQECYESDAQDEQVQSQLAECYFALRRYKKALPLYCALVETHGDSYEYLYALALSMAHQQAYTEAAELMTRAVDASAQSHPALSQQWTQLVFNFRQQAVHHPTQPTEQVAACIQRLQLKPQAASVNTESSQ